MRVPLVGILVTAPLVLLHATPQQPSNNTADTFDAVSIRPYKPGDTAGYRESPGGRIVSEGQTIVGLLARAHGVRVSRVVDGPQWMRSERFVIQTTASGAVDRTRMQAMLRHMLADRFKLVTHMEQRKMPTYVLTIDRPGRLGPNLRPRASPCEPGKPLPPDSVPRGIQPICGGFLGRTGLVQFGIPMSTLAGLLDNLYVGEPIVDQTGLTGTFDVFLTNVVNQWTDNPLQAEAAAPDALRLPVALEDQLGLRLERRPEVADVVVVDRIEKPTEN